MAVCDPVVGDGGAGGEHFLQDHIALKGAAFLAAVVLGPGHADPALGADLAAELGVVALPAFGALGRGTIGEGIGEEAADLLAESLSLGAGRRRGEGKVDHGDFLAA